MKMFVFLGNPGPEYAETRHNAGWWMLNRLMGNAVTLKEDNQFKGEVGAGVFWGEKVVLVRPLTFMNSSGESARAVMDFYKINPEDVYVFYDEIDVNPGDIKISVGGGAGGHNGIKSMQQHCGDKFTKIRIGVGRPAPGYTIVNWVLGKIDKVSSDLILEGFEKFVEAAPNIFTDFNEFVRTMNTKKKEKKSEK